MLRTVAIGIDDPGQAGELIGFAQAVAPGAQLILVNAYAFDGALTRFLTLGYGDALRDTTEQVMKAVREDNGVPDARIELIADTSPARALQHAAQRWDADLIVIGGTHRGPVGRVTVGDVTRSTVLDAPCPVAVVPIGGCRGPITTIGVGFDGSPESREALALAAGVARAIGARIVALYAVQLPIPVDAYAIDLREAGAEMRLSALAATEEAVADLGVPAEARAEIMYGAVRHGLDGLAAEVDLLVTGSRRWGALRRVIVGSMSDHLIHALECPVLVALRPADEQA